MVPSSISKSSTSLSRRPKTSAKLTATEVTPCSMLDPVRFCETRRPLASAMAAVIRAVVVLPLLPVITIFLALLAPMTDLRTFGSMRRAIMPGRLVPPPICRKRPDAPASLPAAIARARRALPSPVGAALTEAVSSPCSVVDALELSVIMILIYLLSCTLQTHSRGQPHAALAQHPSPPLGSHIF